MSRAYCHARSLTEGCRIYIDKMRVLLVSPYGGVPGGISRWTAHIIAYHKSRGQQNCKLDLVPMGRDKFVNINSPIVYRLWTALQEYRKILKDYRQKLCQNQYDVMHLTSSASLSLFKDLYIIRKAKQRGIKSIVHFRFGRIPELEQVCNWEWKLLVKVVKRADQAVVIDKASYETLRQNGFDNVSLLPNLVAPRVATIATENSGLKRTSRSILFVGHVVKTKGVFELLEACSKIENIHLQLAGYITSDMRVQIDEKYKDASWLTICGEKPYDEVIKEMCKCDVFVLPTYTEGFPNVILESMACGCAIVATPVGAIPEMLEEEDGKHYGIMVEPHNVEQLRIAIEKMLSDGDFKNECRANVRQRVNERYNIDSVWRQMVNIWSETIAQ